MKQFLSILCCIACFMACSPSENFTKCTMKLDGKGEITLKRTEAKDAIGFRIEISDPVALRTLMMQGFSLQMLGTKSDTTIIVFPSAKDVNNQIEHHPGEVKATLDGEKEKRPDIRPLVAALKKADVRVAKSGLRMLSVADNHDVSINPASGVLSYSIEVPCDYICEGYNVVTLLSFPDKDMRASSEYSANPDVPTSIPHTAQPFGVNSDRVDEGMQKHIKIDFILDNMPDGK